MILSPLPEKAMWRFYAPHRVWYHADEPVKFGAGIPPHLFGKQADPLMHGL